MNSRCLAALWISAEQWSPGSWNPIDECVDVIATLEDGSRWSATICSFEHVRRLRSKWEVSGECLSGRYLWAANLILSASTARAEVEALLEDLIATGEFSNALASIIEKTQ
jgi:hypothetical protein